MKRTSTEFGPAFDRARAAAPAGLAAHPLGPVFITAHDRDLAVPPDFIDHIFALFRAGTKIMKMAEYAGIITPKIGDGSRRNSRLLWISPAVHQSCEFGDRMGVR